MNSVNCPECDAIVEVESDAMVGEVVTCPDCGADLEIVDVDPLQVEMAPDAEEDWGE